MKEYDEYFGKRDCKNCGNEYIAYREWQEFCSVFCRTQDYKNRVPTIAIRIKQVIECPHCNQSIDLKLIKENKK